MLQRSSFKGAAIFLLLALVIATVASVPTSVLVQNSEMASNSNGKNGNINNNNNSNLSNLKVKRSSNSNNNMKESAASAAAALNKKSSPEIVPASYNSPPQTASFSSSSSPSMTNSARQGNAGVSSLPTNGDIINSAIAAGLTAAAIEAAAAASQRELEQQQQQQQYVADDYGSNNEDIESPTLLRKRGISSQQYLYGAGGGVGGGGVGGGAGGYGYGYAGNGDYYNNPIAAMAAVPAGAAAAAAGVPNGVWADEIDPQLVYSDLQEFDDYAPRAPYHNKAYDNLQNILNSETYLEPVALPLQYTGRYYGADADRKKRSNLNKLNKKYADMRLKRDTKLTPADMLALVALVEAGERARKDTDADASYITYPDPYSSSSSSGGSNNYNYSPKNSYYPPTYDFQPNNNLDEVSEYNGGSLGSMSGMGGMGAGGGAWLEPSVVDYYGVPYNMETLPKYELPPREHKYAANNRYSNKRFMVSKKKRSMGQFLNEPVAKPSFSYSSANGEKYF